MKDSSNHPATAVATNTQERIIGLDVLRGFALFGVLLVNMVDFSGSAFRAGTFGLRGDEISQLTDVAIAFFAVTKFYLLFSFLFGVGFAVQMRRVEGRQRPFVGLYLRRLAVLFSFGLIHAILLWDGDILQLYALAGVLLLILRRAPNTVLIGLAVLIGAAGLIGFSGVDPNTTVSNLMQPEAVRLFTEGSYADLVNFRANRPVVFDIQIPMVLVMFLIGLLVGRNGFLDDPARYTPFLRRWWKWALPVGVVGNGLLIAGYATATPWMLSIGVHVGAPALSFVYGCAVLLNTDRLRFLAPVGQMALTNYLSHSLICTTLFYGYGFGLYDQLAPLATVLLVVAIYGGQVILSRAWMGRFRFGPLEWVWRTLTYGKAEPLIRKPNKA